MKFNFKKKVKQKKALSDRIYFGWICMRPIREYGIVRKRFALFPTRIDDDTVVWLQFYYSFLVQQYGPGLHDGWHWSLYKRALNPLHFRGHQRTQTPAAPKREMNWIDKLIQSKEKSKELNLVR